MDVLDETVRVLLRGGPVTLSTSVTREEWVSVDHDGALLEIDLIARENAPGRAPALNLGAARWALGRLGHLAQRIVARADDAEVVEAEFKAHRGLGAPKDASAESVWSVDLALRHLESIERAARGLVPSDPLRLEVWALARDWPFSAVALPSPAGPAGPADTGVEVPAIPECVHSHSSLRRLYLDRVTAAQSVAHGEIPWVTGALISDHGRRPAWLAPRELNQTTLSQPSHPSAGAGRAPSSYDSQG